MENIIKNIHMIADQKLVNKLEALAAYHKRYARIYFKIKELRDKSISIQVTQEKSPQENHASSTRLTEITHELFDEFFKDKTVHVHAIPYSPPPSEVVDPKWILSKMKKMNVTTKTLVQDLGIAKAEISAFTRGLRPLSNRTKGLFYYYFMYRDEKEMA